MINDLLNSVVRVLLSYGGSHWFKSNSRYILLDTRVKGMVSNKFFYSSSFNDFVSFPSYFISLSFFLFFFFIFFYFYYLNLFVVALELNYYGDISYFRLEVVFKIFDRVILGSQPIPFTRIFFPNGLKYQTFLLVVTFQNNFGN